MKILTDKQRLYLQALFQIVARKFLNPFVAQVAKIESEFEDETAYCSRMITSNAYWIGLLEGLIERRYFDTHDIRKTLEDLQNHGCVWKPDTNHDFEYTTVSEFIANGGGDCDDWAMVVFKIVEYMLKINRKYWKSGRNYPSITKSFDSLLENEILQKVDKRIMYYDFNKKIVGGHMYVILEFTGNWYELYSNGSYFEFKESDPSKVEDRVKEILFRTINVPSVVDNTISLSYEKIKI